ncbi:hypothetical protein DSO57_1005348 [Entomophthora muscae]|uniref:Uncharacterized protein n=1 Tax=Entomophthora muscae TaxID=34485 RepID=A0ACC2RMM6_9FUNG|nr:hypothetical protein DSO57_1005348 [Entomophthora muscae]
MITAVALLAIILGTLFLGVGPLFNNLWNSNSIIVTMHLAKTISSNKKLILDKGLRWTFDFYSGYASGYTIGKEQCIDHSTANYIFRKCFKATSISFWIPYVEQVEHLVCHGDQSCGLNVSLAPKIEGKPNSIIFDNKSVHYYVIKSFPSYPLGQENGYKTKISIPAHSNYTFKVKPIFLIVEGLQLQYLSSSNKPNHTRQEDFKVAITDLNGVLAGFYSIQEVKYTADM